MTAPAVTRPDTTTHQHALDTQTALVNSLQRLLDTETHRLDVMRRQQQQLDGVWQRYDIPAQRSET